MILLNTIYALIVSTAMWGVLLFLGLPFTWTTFFVVAVAAFLANVVYDVAEHLLNRWLNPTSGSDDIYRGGW